MLSPKQFAEASFDLSNFIVWYQELLKQRKISVLPNLAVIEPGYLRQLIPVTAPEDPEEFATILKDFKEKIMPGMTHWQHPNFHAYYPTCSTYPSLLGDFLSLAVAPVGLTWLACPACTELEVITLDWLSGAMKLPEKFLSTYKPQAKQYGGGGMIESSASVVCATVAMSVRQNKLRQLVGSMTYTDEELVAGTGPGSVVDRMVAYSSDQAHSSVARAFKIAMFQYREIPSKIKRMRRLFDAQLLRRAVEADQAKGLIPVMCVATMGTTATCEFDDLESIGRVCQQFGIYFYVDAAYAGNALICPEFRQMARGIEYADAICVNGNKLMGVNLDSTFVWISDQQILCEAFQTDPAYLNHSFKGMPEYRNWGLSLGRRFRSLKLWFVLRMFGLKGLRANIRKHVQMAKSFQAHLNRDPRFEVINDVRLGLVCFRVKGVNELTRRLHDQLLMDGRVFLVPGIVKEPVAGEDYTYFLRFVASPQTQVADVKYTYQVLRSILLSMQAT